ncbi:MAG: arginyl-tRNA synthetase [Actinomycetota bacterium]|jgi:arginyl-tRNA synthetase
MPDPLLTIRPRLQRAIAAVLGPESEDADPVLRRSDRADYQANAAMALAKQVGRNPRQLAEEIVAAADLTDIVASMEVAGPGFINLTLRDDYLSSETDATAADPRLSVPVVTRPETVVVDYSSPNVAREMHVGHLRSTVIGDALVRMFTFLGHRVVRHNHLGDWGTQFGMLIEYLVDEGWERSEDHKIGDLNALYQSANLRFAGDDHFTERARRRVVALQGGDQRTLELWRELVEESERHFEQVYERLGVTLTAADYKPESFYNDMLDNVAEELERAGLARIDDGALCAFPAGFVGRDGAPLPLIVRKRDGGYGYQATDLAAVRYRTREVGGTWLVYAVDARQSQHLTMVFAVAAEAGWLGDGRRAEHVAFGMILGDDNKPFKTRTGDNVKLIDLLDEAVERAAAVVAEKNPELDEATRAEVADAIGVGAIKYADLSNDRVKDYVFDWDRMLSFEGNTAPYLQYAQVRARSILRRVAEERGTGPGPVVLTTAEERTLALHLLSFGDAVHQAAEQLQPHRLATYLFELAQAFTGFFESSPVLRADTDEQRASRLTLTQLTARTLATGLELLGIAAPERM